MAYGPWSNVVTGSATVTGTWIQNPASPAATVVHFPYGGVGKQEAQDRAKTAMQFAGRAYPVYDVGEPRAETVQVTTTISNEDGIDHKALAEKARDLGRNADVILYRDGRGRKIYGIISDWSMTDTEMGRYEVSFLVNRVDYDEALVAPS